jgi:hypothetical protein
MCRDHVARCYSVYARTFKNYFDPTLVKKILKNEWEYDIYNSLFTCFAMDDWAVTYSELHYKNSRT